MDVISMHQAGFTNSVAGCGTALTSEQVRQICRYAKEVILAYDADEAGQKAVQKAMYLFKDADIKVRVPVLQYGKDPDEIIKTVGAEKFGAMLDGATNETEFKILKLRDKYNLNTTQGKADFAAEVIKVLSGTSPVECDLYLSRISDELGIEKRSLKAQYDDYVKRTSYRERRQEMKKIISDDIRNNTKMSFESDSTVKKIKAEERLLYLLLKYPDCAKLLGDFDSSYLSSGFIKKCFAIALEKIYSGADTDLMNFGDAFTMEESGRFTKIVATGKESVNPKTEFIDCLNAVKNEFAKKHNKSTSAMSDDEFRKFFGN